MKMRWMGILALAALSASSLCLPAQTGRITGIGHIAYRVSDMDKEVAFLGKLGYEESFGFTDAAGKTTEVFVKVNDREFIEIYPQTDPAQPLGWMHVCYEADDISALITALNARGLAAKPVHKAGAGNLISALDDPEKRVTEFTQYMPGSRHTLDKGLHLGANRISDKLLGFEVPVPDVEAARKFYVAGLGFEAREGKAGLRLSLPAAPDLRIQIRAAAAGGGPETLFRVADAEKTAEQLKALGITAKLERNRVLVSDPDGNVFGFVAPRSR